MSQPALCVSLRVASLRVPEEPFLWMRNLNFRDGDSSKWWGILAPLWMCAVGTRLVCVACLTRCRLQWKPTLGSCRGASWPPGTGFEEREGRRHRSMSGAHGVS